jgi:hypothetical protein
LQTLGLQGDELGRMGAKRIGVAAAPAIVDLQITADGPPAFLQPLHKSFSTAAGFRIVLAET